MQLQSSYWRNQFTVGCVNFKIASKCNNIRRRACRVLHLYNWQTPTTTGCTFRSLKKDLENCLIWNKYFFLGKFTLYQKSELIFSVRQLGKNCAILWCWQTRLVQKTFQDSLVISEKQIEGQTWNHQFSASKWDKVVLSYNYKEETIFSILFRLFQQFVKQYQVDDYLITALTF